MNQELILLQDVGVNSRLLASRPHIGVNVLAHGDQDVGLRSISRLLIPNIDYWVLGLNMLNEVQYHQLRVHHEQDIDIDIQN